MANIFLRHTVNTSGHLLSHTPTEQIHASTKPYYTLLLTAFPHITLTENTYSHTVTWIDTHTSWLMSRVLNVGNHDGRRSLARAEDDTQKENHVINLSLLQPAINATSDWCGAMGLVSNA